MSNHTTLHMVCYTTVEKVEESFHDLLEERARHAVVSYKQDLQSDAALMRQEKARKQREAENFKLKVDFRAQTAAARRAEYEKLNQTRRIEMKQSKKQKEEEEADQKKKKR